MIEYLIVVGSLTGGECCEISGFGDFSFFLLLNDRK